MIRVAIFDIDGTATNGDIHHFDDGEKCYRGRTFSTLDSKGIWLLRQSGVQVWICGGDDSLHLKDRLNWIGVDGMLLNPIDKRDVLKMLPAIYTSEVAFMGNDVNDLPLMEMVGVVACPHDAYWRVSEYVFGRGYADHNSAFVSPFGGGKGAVRDFCDWIIKRNLKETQRPSR